MDEARRERLYNLLPTIYRIRDTSQGEPLRALLNALESEFRIVEADIEALYDNWFIETCDDWVIPYIADQLGIYNDDDTRKLFSSQRRQVANTIGYRRRKGIAAILEHVLQDVTGWHTRLIEYGQLLSSSQHLGNIAGDRGRFADLRQATELALLGGPFETTAHTIDIHSTIDIQSSDSAVEPPSRGLQGKYQPNNVGVFVWRLQSYPMNMVPARAITREGERQLPLGCFTFDPLGRSLPLWNQPQTFTVLTRRVDATNLPGLISRIAFANDLEDYRKQHLALLGEEERDLFTEDDFLHNSAYYGPERSLCIILKGDSVLPAAVVSADLSQWNLPPAGSYGEHESMVAIDVALGRMRFFAKEPLAAGDVEVNYCYGFSGDLGGGPYTRILPLSPAPRYRINVLRGGKAASLPDASTQEDLATPGEDSTSINVGTLRDALKQWESYCHAWEQNHQGVDASLMDRPRATIQIVDNGVYDEGHLIVKLPKDSDLVIEATNGMRPVITGPLTVNSDHASASLQLNGLLMEGKLDINDNLNLEIAHCTLMPHGLAARQSSALAGLLQISIDHSIVGPIQLEHQLGELTITDSIIDHASGYAIDTLHTESERGPVVRLERVTIFGKVQVHKLQLAQDVIFTQPVEVRQRAGLVSCSYVPPHSHTPHRDRCQPQIGPGSIGADLSSTSPMPGSIGADLSGTSPIYRLGMEDESQVYPFFSSTRYGDAAYAQLAINCSPSIRRGASNGSEMGAFNSLQAAQRQDNIIQALNEYLPFGLAADVFYVT